MSDFLRGWSTLQQQAVSQELPQALKVWFQEPWHMASPPSPTPLTPHPRGNLLRPKPTETSPPTNSPPHRRQHIPSSLETNPRLPGSDTTLPSSTSAALVWPDVALQSFLRHRLLGIVVGQSGIAVNLLNSLNADVVNVPWSTCGQKREGDWGKRWSHDNSRGDWRWWEGKRQT